MEEWYKNDYNKLVTPYATNKPRIVVDPLTIKKINELVRSIIDRKRVEEHHLIDFGNEYKLFYTGLIGEAAMEQYFGENIIDWSVGDSSFYNEADLKKQGLNIGIKTVEAWKFPIVHKKVYRPELINVKLDEKTVVFFGYASKKVLEENQDDKYILSSMLKARGTKSAFLGFSQLIMIKDINELKKINKGEIK